MLEFDNEVKAINPELQEGVDIDVPIGINILDKIKPAVQTELLNYILEAQDTLKRGMDINSTQYHGYTNVWEWWKELDRCYLVIKKERGKKNKEDSRGESDTVSPLFHYTIDADMLSMTKVFNSLPKKFAAVSMVKLEMEHLGLAEAIVKDSIIKGQVVKNFKQPAYELSNHGNCWIKSHLVVKDVEISAFNDLLLDEFGQAQVVNGEFLHDVKGPSWKKQLVRKVYTAFEPVSKDRFLVNLSISDIKKQPVIVEGRIFTIAELRDMEERGEITDLDQYIVEQEDCEGLWDSANTHDEKEDRKIPEDCQTKTINEVHLYFKDVTKKNGETKMYQVLVGNNKRLLSVKEYIYDSWRFVSGVRGTNPCYPAIGVGKGQVIYPGYLYYNKRLNQIMDVGDLESLGGGICDSKVKGFLTKAKAGTWQGIPNFNPDRLIAKSWREFLGVSSANMMKDLNVLEEQIAKAVPQILTGQPTGTSADRSGAGMSLLGNNALTTLETEFKDVEGQIFGTWAKDAYKNFILYLQENVKSEDELRAIMFENFGTDVTTYQGQPDEQHPDGVFEVKLFQKVYPEVDFEFCGAEEAAKKIEDSAIIRETLGFLAQLAQIIPEQIGEALQTFDVSLFLKQYLNATGLGDVDTYFPALNPSAQLLKMKQDAGFIIKDGTIAKEALARLIGDLQAASVNKAFGNQELINKIKDITSGIENQMSSKNQ